MNTSASHHRSLIRDRRLRLVAAALVVAISALCASASARAAVSCPNSNPIVNENNCMGAGTTAWRLSNGNPNGVAGFAVTPSVNLGSPVQLKLGSTNASGVTVKLALYRMGYYGGTGGRLVYSNNSVDDNNYINCNGQDPKTGETDCDNWSVSTTIPASAFPVSGVYIAKITNPSTGDDNQIVIVVRDDGANAPMLVKIPTATYQAYNQWGNRSLYCQISYGTDLIGDGCPRALAVSFERPIQNVTDAPNYFLHDEFALVYWLEEQGYNISYTDSTAIAADPSSLLSHKVIVVGGHDEYWSGAELTAMKAARDHGVSIASFSANTSYWKVEYEDGGQTMAEYKTVQDGSKGINDPGPDAPTTTFRDPGAAAGSANAPPGGRVGPNTPENALWGNLYIGDNDDQSYPLVVPPADGQGQYAGADVWRNTGISTTQGATIGSNLVGWEWDAIPNGSSSLYNNFLGVQPSGVTALTRSPVTNGNPEFVQDYGDVYGTAPPSGQPAATEAVMYRAASGARVFAAGTIQWPWALGPYFIPNPGSGNTYFQAPTNTEDPRIAQATYNIFSDMGLQPTTPSSSIVLDSDPGAPRAAFSASPTTVTAGSSVSFDGSQSTSSGTITDYKWDLDGDGGYETDTGKTATTSHTYTTPGTVTVSLKVTDSTGQTATVSHTVTVVAPATGYAAAVEQTPGLSYYWRMGDPAGSTTLSPAFGSVTGQLSGGASTGQPGAISGDSTTSTTFDGVSGSASAPIDLSADGKVTVEFWMNWRTYANNDQLAFELTPNFNSNPGGFLVDPNAPEQGGEFGVGIGEGSSRNNIYFPRPTAGAWHHYAFVMDTTATGATEITPYVDGKAVAYTQTANGTGAGNFANATLYWFSRAGSGLFGGGSVQDLAIYGQALSAATIQSHYQAATGGGGTTTTTSTTPTTTTTTPTTSTTPTTTTTTTTITPTTTTSTTPTTTTTTTTTGTTPTGYPAAVQATPGLDYYWRMGDPAGSKSISPAFGSVTGSLSGGASPGQPGAIAGDPTTSTSFDGASGSASAAINLSTTNQVTIEFWMKWNTYANNDQLAFELTPNFNNNAGGFLVDPNAPEQGGEFGVGIGKGSSRNNAYFPRPSAGVWHHYAFVLNTTATGATQITPYVDGQPVAFTQTAKGTGAGKFAKSTLYWFSRAGSALFGGGSVQELAIYGQALSAATIQSHYQAATSGH